MSYRPVAAFPLSRICWEFVPLPREFCYSDSFPTSSFPRRIVHASRVTARWVRSPDSPYTMPSFTSSTTLSSIHSLSSIVQLRCLLPLPYPPAPTSVPVPSLTPATPFLIRVDWALPQESSSFASCPQLFVTDEPVSH